MNLRIASCCIAALTITACGRYGDREIEWAETVSLSSGDAVLVERVQRVEIHLTSEGPSGNLAKMATVTSAASQPEFPTWRAKMFPILLDRDPANEEWVLVATMYDCDFWLKNGQPDPPYWGFRAANGSWRRAPIPASFWDRPANLFAVFQSTDDSGTLRASYQSRRAEQIRSGKPSKLAGVWRDMKPDCKKSSKEEAYAIEVDLWQFGKE
jgi:hypothetical protein